MPLSVHFAAVPTAFDGLFVEETHKQSESLILVTLDGLRWQVRRRGFDAHQQHNIRTTPPRSGSFSSRRPMTGGANSSLFFQKIAPAGLVLGNG